MDPTPDPADFVEVYHAESLMAAQKIVDVLLTPEGIPAQLRDRIDQVFPSVAQPGGVYIAVPSGRREQALAVLDEARENGYLDGEDGERV
jgi:hypothetical protein